MPNLTVSSAVDTMMQATNQAGLRSALGLSLAPRLLWSEDFTGASYDTTVLKAFNGATLSFEAANDRLAVTAATSSNARGVYLDNVGLGLVAGQWYAIEATWTGSCAMNGISAWSDANMPRSAALNTSQRFVHWHLQSAAGTGAFHSPILLGVSNSHPLTWYLTSVKVFAFAPSSVPVRGETSPIVIGSDLTCPGSPIDSIIIGNGITCSSGNENIVIGNNASELGGGSTIANTVIGNSASASVTVSGGNSSGARVALGNSASAHSWRATAIGSNAKALATSATALGVGCVSELIHGCAIGRGAYIPSTSDIETVLGSYTVSIGNPYHRSDVPASGLSTSESDGTVDPATVVCRLHGKDAGDIRASPSDTNKGGGTLEICAGRGIGTGVGGKLALKTAPAGSSGATKNTLVTAVELDAVATGGSEETRFLLLDLTDGTLKRVSFGADDSGGSGFKLLRVAN